MRCPVCVAQSERSTVRHDGYARRTLMGYSPGYYDEDGAWVKNRDPNTTTQGYRCSSGHYFEIKSLEGEPDRVYVPQFAPSGAEGEHGATKS